ncbi:ATP-binding cassette subfamily B protein [Roseivirga pacifica]|uniref:ATP-binding cassette, subfamily B n=1 Tax=Roseivirga pacifica TaxID=1267423 RepID=A0A1I0NTA7_9BACT|nr:ABC transporter ATP-binding protein [Roseivirga pacifica]MCO6359983.1 ATP-binding cassette domain-containing protein [Roseivirga pacifica]MCO6367353.1 ATP-binding cassette domain-containing protein [Roseivirga pacifica]MCO6370116.1 ATP-binding cassette domain-containing protein [Roseivirga pacifica]MCO6375010.1 ATP-binding cassette domain-containing protein [Roseivirga pacifica]MCO6380268.1 ATP-binding cassette domain-containing protein [Roseivirga pacifica]
MEKEKDKIKGGNVVDFQVLRRLFQFAKPYIKHFYFLVFLTVFLAVLMPIRPILVQKAIDEYVPQGDYNGLVFILGVLVAHLIVLAIVQYSHTYLSGWFGQVIIRDIRVKLYRHLLSLKLKFFDKTPIGRLVTRNVSDIETLSNVFSEGIAALIGDLLQLVFLMGYMFYLDWRLTLVSLSTLPLLIFSTYVFKEKIKVTFNQVRNAVSNLNSFVQEHVTGMSIVQIFNAEEREFDKFKQINSEHKKAHIRSVLYYAIYFPVAEIIQAIAIGMAVWYGARGMLVGLDAGPGVIIAFIMYIQMFFRPIRMIADRFNTLQMGIVSSNRIFKLLDSDEHLDDNGSYAPKELKGDVSFKNVWFAYNEENYVLKDISFEVKEGQTVALVGATGAGKSSVINLLSRFYDINKGQITIDGRDIKDFDLGALRERIGVVLQDVFLFSDTIKQNITLGNNNISDEKIRQAAELVGAKKFIERLPQGYDYNVMERGSTLSVGQRQLISFVRAMVYDPKIIVLDEATSSVDSETEELIQNAIEVLMKGRTSIVIAHRLSTIQGADKIIVLDKGEIKEVGSHKELLEKEGFYANLYNMQYKEVVA